MGEKTNKTSAEKSFLGSVSVYLTLIVLGLAIVMSSVFYLNLHGYAIFGEKSEELNWMSDSEFRKDSSSTVCEFKTLTVSQLQDAFPLFSDSGVPILIKSAAINWPARDNWRKNRLLAVYGNRTIQSGSESSIVYSGGTAGTPVLLKDIVNNADDFVFDASILKSIPEFMSDVEIPHVVREWDSPAYERQGSMWHMLSLGPSRTGLPFHSHGKTWIAVIHGAKRWFVYPPGYSAPVSIDQSFNPLLPVWAWLQQIYPQLHTLTKPPLSQPRVKSTDSNTADSDQPEEIGHRPLECLQQAGDIVFLPARWSHLTVNVGETIAIGGQASLPAKPRYTDSMKVLKKHPGNYEALKDVGLGLSHMAMEKSQFIRSSVEELLSNRNSKRGSRKSVLSLKSTFQLETLLEVTQDTWLVLYAKSVDDNDSSNDGSRPKSLTLEQLIFRAEQLQSKLSTICDVALIGVKPNTAQDEEFTYTIRLHIGGKTQNEFAAILNSFTIDSVGTLYSTGDDDSVTSNVDDIVAFVQREMQSKQLLSGTVSTLTVVVQNMFAEATDYLRKAVQLKPLHPETRGLLGEVYGLAENIPAMRESISESVELFRAMNSTGISLQSRASVFHKLATAYLSKELSEDAIPLLHLSLDILPTYLPAVADLTVSYYMSNNKIAAKQSLKRLVELAPTHSSIKRLKKAINGMK